MVKAETFYKVKERMRGRETPGGFMYVIRVNGDKVTCTASMEPDVEKVAMVAFVLNVADFEELIEEEYREVLA